MASATRRRLNSLRVTSVPPTLMDASMLRTSPLTCENGATPRNRSEALRFSAAARRSSSKVRLACVRTIRFGAPVDPEEYWQISAEAGTEWVGASRPSRLTTPAFRAPSTRTSLHCPAWTTSTDRHSPSSSVDVMRTDAPESRMKWSSSFCRYRTLSGTTTAPRSATAKKPATKSAPFGSMTAIESPGRTPRA